MSERDARTVMYEREAAQVRVQREHEALVREREAAGETRTLRDWFAGQALAGFCADPTAEWRPAGLGATCYIFADAMLAEREKSDV